MALYVIEKRGTGIYLMKEKAKIHREHKNKAVHHISKRLASQISSLEEAKQDGGVPEKRKNLGGGHYQSVDGKQADTKMHASNK